jgi:uncharacterized membrane protein (GlpM family)
VFPGNSLFVPPYPLAYVLAPFASFYIYLRNAFDISSISISQVPPNLRPNAVWAVQVVPSPLFDFLIKIPFVISDIIVALLVYRIAFYRTRDKVKATSAASLWFLNPYTIWVSSAWGMYDTIPALLTCLCLVMVWKRRFFLAGGVLVLAFSFKLYPAFLLPFVLIYIKRSSPKDRVFRLWATFLIGVSLTGILLYADYLGQIAGFVGSVVASPNFTANINRSTLPPGFGLTYWTLSAILPMRSFIVPLSVLASLLLLPCVYYLVLRKKSDDPLLELVTGFVAIIAALFLTFRFVGENFAIWIVPFLAILATEGEIRRSLFWAISGVALLFSVTNSLLPIYLLPIVPWLGQPLSQIMALIQPFRSAASGGSGVESSVGSLFLVSLGIAFSALMAILIARVVRNDGRRGNVNGTIRIYGQPKEIG